MKQLINIILIALLSLLIVKNLSYAGTLQDCKQVENIVTQECNKFGKSCKIYIDTKDSTINAHGYTLGSGYMIVFSAEMTRNFNYYQLLAVALHEIGHIRNGDVELLKRLAQEKPEMLIDKFFRHRLEFDADNYATNYFGEHCMHNYTVDIMYKLNKVDMNKESNTHPSLNARIINSKAVYRDRCQGVISKR